MGSIDKFATSQVRQHPYESPQQRLPAFSPTPASPQSRSRSADTSPRFLHNSHIPILPKPTGIPQRVALPSNALRLITENLEFPEKGAAVDKERLTRIYEAHRVHFWSTIASDYGDEASPAVLEEVWCRLSGSFQSTFPPTPSASPRCSRDAPSALGSAFSASTESTGYSGSSPVKSQGDVASAATTVERSSFAISSLLTEDKEVRTSPSQDRGVEAAEMK